MDSAKTGQTRLLRTTGQDFSKLGVPIATGADGVPVLLNYGMAVQSIVNFLIIAVALFMAIKGINKVKPPATPAAPPAPSRQDVLLAEIRDLLAKR